MNTNMTGFGWFSKKYLRPCALDEGSLSIKRVKQSDIFDGILWTKAMLEK